MVRLGGFKKEKQKMSFKEWLKSGRMKEGRYRVRILFPPSKYPTFSFIFETDDTEVKMTVDMEKVKEALQALGVQLGKRDLPALDIVIDAEGYGIDINKEEYLQWRGSYWIRQKKDDIPF